MHILIQRSGPKDRVSKDEAAATLRDARDARSSG